MFAVYVGVPKWLDVALRAYCDVADGFEASNTITELQWYEG